MPGRRPGGDLDRLIAAIPKAPWFKRAGKKLTAGERRAAAAATQACYQGALALLAGADRRHAFSAKLTLFLRGRWPLGILGGRAYIF